MGEGRIWRTTEEKINSTQTETKWVAGDGERLSGLGLLRSTDIYRVADRSSPSSPWKVQTHTDPQRKCYGRWINALSHPSARLPSILVCYGCHSRLCARPVSCLSFTTKGRFLTWSKNTVKLFLRIVCVRVQRLCVLSGPGRQTGMWRGVGTQGGGRLLRRA